MAVLVSPIWDGFEGGESQRSISRRLDRPPSTIRTHLVWAGFRRPLPAGDWSTIRLSLTEREEISRVALDCSSVDVTRGE